MWVTTPFAVLHELVRPEQPRREHRLRQRESSGPCPCRAGRSASWPSDSVTVNTVPRAPARLRRTDVASRGTRRRRSPAPPAHDDGLFLGGPADQVRAILLVFRADVLDELGVRGRGCRRPTPSAASRRPSDRRASPAGPSGRSRGRRKRSVMRSASLCGWPAKSSQVRSLKPAVRRRACRRPSGRSSSPSRSGSDRAAAGGRRGRSAGRTDLRTGSRRCDGVWMIFDRPPRVM